jgi:Tol biopolymer transport system component
MGDSMSRTRKSQAARYLTLLITGAVLGVPMKPAAQRARAAGATAEADAIVQATPTPRPVRGRYNGKIVFTSDRHNEALSIWSMNPDGSSPTRLTDDKSRTERLPSFAHVYDSGPAWSPDGTKIAFISNRNSYFALYIMNADGSNVQLVTDKVLEPGGPAWSPDGGKIAFSAGVGITIEPSKPFSDVYLVNLDGSGLTKLTSGSGQNGSVTWSPDGKQIAFASNRDPDGMWKIWVMNVDGSNQRRLTDIQNPSIPKFYGGQPSWSPDGTKILFNRFREIFVMNADGSNARPLTNDPNRRGMYLSPRWSPDGTKIVTTFYQETRNGIDSAKEIIVMNADGSNQINISNRGKYYFNSGQSSFVDGDADWQPLLAPPNFAPSVIGFSAPSYTVYEDAGSVPITVKRTGNLNDVASCFHVTLDDTATIKYYDPSATGTLWFAPGESSKTIFDCHQQQQRRSRQLVA